jgi:dATP pyrophosphohydrolase
MQKPYKRPESILVVIYYRSQVLLLERKDRKAFWQSVTGSLLPEETSAMAAAWRELREETGFSALDGDLTDCNFAAWFDIYPEWQFRYEPGVTQNLEHVFTFELKELKEPVLSEEHIDFCWLTKEQAALKVFSASNREAILKFI